MLLNEIFKGMFDPAPDKLVRELSKLFYKKWAPKLKGRDSTAHYDQLMTKYKELAEKHRKGIDVTVKLDRLRDIVAHAADRPHTDIKLKRPGFYD